jgi:hypothetical protein
MAKKVKPGIGAFSSINQEMQEEAWKQPVT